MTSLASRWAVPFLVLPSISIGCAQILGIEEAVCDPDLDDNCSVGTSADDGDDDTDDGDDDSDEALDSGPPVLDNLNDLCDAYCNQVAEVCTPEVGAQQYPTPDACIAVCRSGMDLGAPGDKDEGVDTAFCRFENAMNAGAFGEIEVDCASAGLGANGACGDVCDVYCELLGDVCEDATTVEGVEIVFDDDACIAECEALPRTPEPFDYEVTAGNTLECRLWHVQAAFNNKGVHCPHATGLAPCVDP